MARQKIDTHTPKDIILAQSAKKNINTVVVYKMNKAEPS